MRRRATTAGPVIDRVITELIEADVHGVYRLPTETSVTVTDAYPPQPAV